MPASTKIQFAVLLGLCTVVGAGGCTSESARKALSADPAKISVNGFGKNTADQQPAPPVDLKAPPSSER